MSESLHAVRYPGESAEYRARRNALLDAEVALRAQVESVAALRRTLPLGGEVPEDYQFHEGSADPADLDTSKPVRLSELFAPGQDTLILYSFMYGPEMARACPSCTSIIDGLDGETPHVTQRASFVVVAKSPIRRLREHARDRGWRRVRLVSSHGTTFNADYHAETDDGKQRPILQVFVRRGGRVHHFWSSELLFTKPAQGQDPRHVDLVWPLWHLLDVTPEGRGDFHPRLSYVAAPTVPPALVSRGA